MDHKKPGQKRPFQDSNIKRSGSPRVNITYEERKIAEHFRQEVQQPNHRETFLQDCIETDCGDDKENCDKTFDQAHTFLPKVPTPRRPLTILNLEQDQEIIIEFASNEISFPMNQNSDMEVTEVKQEATESESNEEENDMETTSQEESYLEELQDEILGEPRRPEMDEEDSFDPEEPSLPSENKKPREECSMDIKEEKVEETNVDKSNLSQTDFSNKGVQKEKDNDESETGNTVTKSGRIVQQTGFSDATKSPAAAIMAMKTENFRPNTPSPEEMEEKRIKFEQNYPAEYHPGFALWSRVGAAPFWPSAVTHDPDSLDGEKVYTRVYTRGINVFREYHVQFFGKVVQRAWVNKSNLLTYLGRAEFEEKCKKIREEMKTKRANKKSKILRSYFPSGRTKVAWEEAVQELEETSGKTNEERLEHMQYLSDLALKKKQENAVISADRKRRRESAASPLNNENSDDNFSEERSQTSPPPSKMPKFETADQLIQAIPAEVLDNHRRKLKTGFKLFHLANFETVRVELGITGQENGEKAVDKALNKKWNNLPTMERRFYQDQAAKLFEDEETESSLAVDDTDYILLDSEDEAFNDNVSVASSSKSVKSSNSSNSNSNKTETLNTDLIGQFKNVSCCLICEDVSVTPGGLVKCKGVCQGAFHINCLAADIQLSSLDNFKCQECSSGIHSCMLCKASEGTIFKCNVKDCGKFFHPECLHDSGMWPQAILSEKQLTCPAHVCHTCASDNPKEPFMRYNTKLLRCIRCPTAYHAGDFCVTAGTVQITASQIICPKHYVPPPNRKTNGVNHINVTWCFLCSKGGSLICCEKCPASFHTECLNIDQPEGVFHCYNCESGRMPLYNEVLWVKLGHYRWWPAKVVHPAEVPGNIEKLPHSDGEFPIQFCGSKEYYWINQGRCFLYESEDVDKIPGVAASGKAINTSYVKGLKEAAELFESYTKSKQIREAANMDKVRFQKGIKPSLYTKIKTNRPYGDCPVYTEDSTDIQVCECNQETKNPCGPDSECINRLLKIECNPSMCKARGKCNNQVIQKRVYPPLMVHRTQGRGWGLFPKVDIKKGDFIIEYVGELITKDEYRRRLDINKENNYYYMTMDNLRMIDAGPKGNMARFMNHSCDPNCETQKWKVNGDTRVALYATKDVNASEELTFNYQFEAIGDVKKNCLCGAKNCSGFIGEKPKDQNNGRSGNNGSQSESVSNNKKKKVKVVKQKKVWEDLCFRCFDDGKLLMCDHKTCPKVYHLECLGRDKMPREKWFCPWHHCVQCGKPATAHCMHCPNAYCKTHDIIKRHPNLQNICDEHEDDLMDTIEYYKTVVGGIKKILPNPNICLEDVLDPKPSVEEVTEAPKRRESDPVIRNQTDKTFLANISNRHSLGSSLTITKNPSTMISNISDIQNNSELQKKYHCKCIEIDCQWQGKKSRFFDHLVKSHKFSIAVCQDKVRRVLNSMMMKAEYNNENSSSGATAAASNFFNNDRSFETPTKQTSFLQNLSMDSGASSGSNSKYKRGKERLKVCPEVTCLMKMRASNLVRHIKTKHPHVEQERINHALYESGYEPPQDSDDDEGDGNDFNSSLQQKSSSGNSDYNHLASAAVVKSTPDGSDARPSKERMFECQFCGLVMRGSNLGRHIKARHENEATQTGAEVAFIPAAGSHYEGGRKQVECPACKISCRPSNFYRHWKRRHPDLPPPDMKFRRSANSYSNVNLSGQEQQQQQPHHGLPADAVEPVQCDDDEEPDQASAYPLDLSDEELNEEEDNSDTNCDMSCGYLGCTYVGLSKADLALHRRRNGHPEPSVATKRKDQDDFDILSDESFSRDNTTNNSEDDENDNGEMITIEPEIQLTESFNDQSQRQQQQSKHKPAALRDLKYVCDSVGCGYKSRFRQNLDRHCRKLNHFSEYLIRTSKKPNEAMIQLAAENADMAKNDEGQVEAEKEFQSGEEQAYVLDDDDDEVVVPVEPDIYESEGELRLEEEEEEEEDSQVSNEGVIQLSQQDSEEEEDSTDPASSAAN